mmetsp:Transcript_2755/g.6893  ORF Transcript_2755/g.6893 Transcript_2755/m.6893 type:complete len:158 (+) Transcript_2755:114-587(+)
MQASLHVVCVSSGPGSQPRRSAEVQDAAKNAGRRLEGRMAALRASNPTTPGLSFRNREAASTSNKHRESTQSFAVDVSGFELDDEVMTESNTRATGGDINTDYNVTSEGPHCGEGECYDFYARGYTLSTPNFDVASELRAVDHRSLQRLRVPTQRLF